MKPLPFGIFCTLTFSDAGTRQSHPMPSPLKKTLRFKISTPLTDCCSIALSYLCTTPVLTFGLLVISMRSVRNVQDVYGQA